MNLPNQNREIKTLAIGYLVFLGLLIIALFGSGCATQKRCNEKFPTVASKTDSVKTVVKTVVKDSVITIAGATIHDTIPILIDCDEKGYGTIRPIVYTNQKGHVSQTVAIAGNKLVVNCKADSLKQVIQRQAKLIFEQKSQVHKEVKPQIIEVVPGFYRFQNYIAILAEFALFIALMMFLRSLINPKF